MAEEENTLVNEGVPAGQPPSGYVIELVSMSTDKLPGDLGSEEITEFVSALIVTIVFPTVGRIYKQCFVIGLSLPIQQIRQKDSLLESWRMLVAAWPSRLALRTAGYSGASVELTVEDSRMTGYNAHHARFGADEETFTMCPHQFSDLILEEFQTLPIHGLRSMTRSGLPKLNSHVNTGKSVINSIDWTTKGAATPVNTQRQCGTYWTSSSTAETWVASGRLRTAVRDRSLSSSWCIAQKITATLAALAIIWISLPNAMRTRQ